MKKIKGISKPKGGARPGAGRKPKAIEQGEKTFAHRVLGRIGELGLVNQRGEPVRNDEDYSLMLLADKIQGPPEFVRLRDKRDGKAVQTVNYVHDKPIEVNHTISLATEIQEARMRAENFN